MLPRKPERGTEHGKRRFIGVLLIAARVAHAIGLKHDNIEHPGRTVGAGGTALITLAAAGYAFWLVFRSM